MKTFSLLLTLCFCSLPATAKVLDSSPQGFTVQNLIEVPGVDVQTAWNALIHDVDLWWPKDHSWWGKDAKFSIEPRAGGCFCERGGAQEALHMTVTFVDPGKLLRLTGGLGPLQGMGLHGALEFSLAPLKSGPKGGIEISLHYTAGGYTTQDLVKFAPIVDKVQAQQLGGLGAYLRKKAQP